MADRSNFPFLSFLLCYYFPLICALFCDSLIAKEAELDKIPSDTVQLYNNNCVIIRYNESQLPKSRLLSLSSDTKILPYNVLSYLKCQGPQKSSGLITVSDEMSRSLLNSGHLGGILTHLILKALGLHLIMFTILQ